MKQSVKRCLCSLPKKVKSLCDTGCVYREPAFKAFSCPLVKKTDTCAAPCAPADCTCKNGQTQGLRTYKFYHEVRLV